MVRTPCCEKMGLKKGSWTPEEDQILVSHIQQFGHENWRALPKEAGEFMLNTLLSDVESQSPLWTFKSTNVIKYSNL